MARNYHETWAAAVRRWMASAEVSQAKLAKRTGTTGATISRLLKGKQRTRSLILKVSEIAGVEPPPAEGVDPEDEEILELCRRLKRANESEYRKLLARVRAFVEAHTALFP